MKLMKRQEKNPLSEMKSADFIIGSWPWNGNLIELDEKLMDNNEIIRQSICHASHLSGDHLKRPEIKTFLKFVFFPWS